MHRLCVVFDCTLVLCAVVVLGLFVRQCYAPSLCCVCLYVNATRRLCVVFVCTTMQWAIFVLCVSVR